MNETAQRAPSPSFAAQWTRMAVLADGTGVCIRPLRSDDREREIEFLQSLSESTRYFRLMTPLRVLPPHLLDQLMDIDGERRMAFVACVSNDGIEHFIGVARYAAADAAASAELGITVTDAWQHRGVAAHLIKVLLDYASAHGMQEITGFVLPENHGMLRLAKKMGFAVRFSAEDRLMHIGIDLAPPLPGIH